MEERRKGSQGVELPDDLGLRQCPRCGAVMFSDMDRCYNCLFDFSHGFGNAPEPLGVNGPVDGSCVADPGSHGVAENPSEPMEPLEDGSWTADLSGGGPGSAGSAAVEVGLAPAAPPRDRHGEVGIFAYGPGTSDGPVGEWEDPDSIACADDDLWGPLVPVDWESHGELRSFDGLPDIEKTMALPNLGIPVEREEDPWEGFPGLARSPEPTGFSDDPMWLGDPGNPWDEGEGWGSESLEPRPREPKSMGVDLFLPGAKVPVALDRGLLVGRSPDCDLVLDDPHVSRAHLTIHRCGGRLEVEDHGALNPALLGGMPLRGRRLWPSDEPLEVCGAMFFPTPLDPVG